MLSVLVAPLKVSALVAVPAMVPKQLLLVMPTPLVALQFPTMSPSVTSLKTQELAGPPLPLELQALPRKLPPCVPYSLCAIE